MISGDNPLEIFVTLLFFAFVMIFFYLVFIGVFYLIVQTPDWVRRLWKKVLKHET